MLVFAPLMLALAVAQEPVRVAASLSTRDVAVGETVVLQILVQTGGEEPDRIHVPDIPDAFDIVGRAESRALNAGAGGRRREVRVEISLLARLPGRVVIPPATVVVAGVTHRTSALPITVHGTAPAPESSSELEGAELRAWLHPDTVHVGEQALLQVEARMPETLRRGRARPLSYEPPSPTGFWVHDLPDAGVTVLRSVGDRIIEVQSFQRAYFALEPGEYVLPPARVTYEVRRGFLQPAENQRLESDSLHLVVLPLPEEGQPESFRGAVGSFAVRAFIEPERVAAGDVASLIVEVEGEGNIKALPAPVLPEIPMAEVYEPTESAEYSTPAGRLSGVKRFRWILVPRSRGTLTIPAIRYAWFDPESGYREVVTEPIRVDVVEGATGDAELAALDRNPRPARRDDVPLWWLALLVPPVVLLFAVYLVRRRPSRNAPGMTKRWQSLLDHAEAGATSGSREWVGAVVGVLRDAVRTTTGEEAAGAAVPSELAAALRRRGVRRELADEAADLVAELERIRFAPAGVSHDSDALIARARRLIDALAKAARALLVLLCLLSFASSAVAQSAFGAGVAAYESGRFVEAADSFAAHVRAAPQDVAGWYDLGNAAYRADDTGRAAHAWLRALWLEPRHEGARIHLRTNLPAAAVAAPPRFMLSWRTAALLGLLAWWLAFGALALRMLRPGRMWRWCLAGSGFVALAALVLTVGPRVLARDAVSLEDAALRLGPTVGSAGPDRLQPGLPLDVLERRSGWLRVRDPAGREGWIEESQAGPLP